MTEQRNLTAKGQVTISKIAADVAQLREQLQLAIETARARHRTGRPTDEIIAELREADPLP